jgi:hypothetical protein
VITLVKFHYESYVEEQQLNTPGMVLLDDGVSAHDHFSQNYGDETETVEIGKTYRSTGLDETIVIDKIIEVPMEDAVILRKYLL